MHLAEKAGFWTDDRKAAARASKVCGPAPVDGMGPTVGWEDYWKEFDTKRRRDSSWAAHTRSPLVA